MLPSSSGCRMTSRTLRVNANHAGHGIELKRPVQSGGVRVSSPQIYCGPISEYTAHMAAFADLIFLTRSWQRGDISSGFVLVGSKRENVIHRRAFGQ
jgi:hypothetical protein